MVADLAARIEAYISSSKSRSLCKLGRESSVPYTTLRRIATNEVKTVGMGTCIAILRVFENSDAIVAFLRKHFPESEEFIKVFTASLTSKNLSTRDIEDLLGNYSVWYTVCLAERKSGVSGDELERVLGERNARESLELLEMASLVECIDGRYHLKEKNFNTSGSPKPKLAEIKHFCDTYDEKRRSDPGHFLANLVVEWNDDGLTFVRETLRDAALKIFEGSRDSRYVTGQGGLKMGFFGVVAGILEGGE
jgi:hypothetical protein